MKTKLKKLDGSRVELTATLDAADLKKAEDLAIEELAKEVRVEGFRKGKVPMEVAKKFIPENDLGAKTMDLSVRMTVVAAFEQEKQMPLLRPEISITKFVPGEMLEYVATVEVVPEVTLGDWKNLGVKRETAKIEEKDVKGVLDNIAKSFSEKKAIKRAAKLDDEVIIDFVGKKDGVAFPGGSADNYPLMLGSGNFIPGFEDGIVGHEPGDKFDLELTFPKDYGVDDLAGVKTVFSVLLKKVNELTVPKIDDELAKKVGPFKDLKALKEDIKKNLALQTEERLDGKFKDDLVKALVKKSKIGVIPDILINDQMHGIRDNLERNAKTQGLSAEEYLKRGGETMESWEKQAKKVAEENVKASLCLQTLAVSEKVTVDDKLVEAKIAELKDVYRKSPDALKNLKDPAVKQDIKNTYNYIRANEKTILSQKHSLQSMDVRVQVSTLLGIAVHTGVGAAVFAAIVSSIYNRNLKAGLGVIGNISIGGAIERATNFTDRVSLLSENGAKTVIVPMDNLPEMSSLPASILGKTDVPFYANPQNLIQKMV